MITRDPEICFAPHYGCKCILRIDVHLELIIKVDRLSHVRFIKAKHQLRGLVSLMVLVTFSSDCHRCLKV